MTLVHPFMNARDDFYQNFVCYWCWLPKKSCQTKSMGYPCFHFRRLIDKYSHCHVCFRLWKNSSGPDFVLLHANGLCYRRMVLYTEWIFGCFWWTCCTNAWSKWEVLKPFQLQSWLGVTYIQCAIRYLVLRGLTFIHTDWFLFVRFLPEVLCFRVWHFKREIKCGEWILWEHNTPPYLYFLGHTLMLLSKISAFTFIRSFLYSVAIKIRVELNLKL